MLVAQQNEYDVSAFHAVDYISARNPINLSNLFGLMPGNKSLSSRSL